ncbi:MAG: cell division protein FtsQ/DivIB [Actinomycetota bacterium]
MSVDPRLIERRKTVAEHNAKKSVSRLLKFLLFLLLAGSLLWLAFSPWLSIKQVTTSGIAASRSNIVLAEEGVIAGTPMILVSTSRVEQRLLEDSWVAEATVRRVWPDEVTVEVVERTPAAWVRTKDGWTRRAVDGVSLPSESDPEEDMAWIEMSEMADREATVSTDLLGALEFVEALPADLHPGTVVTRVDGEVWATVDDYQVRLGRAVDMTEKALSLDALLGQGIPEGSTVVLIAPTNPAVLTADQVDQSDDEAGEETDAEDQEDSNDENP